MRQKKIKAKFLPQQLPVLASIVYYLLLDKLNAPGWVWGVVFSIIALFAVVAVVSWFQCNAVEPEWKKGE